MNIAARLLVYTIQYAGVLLAMLFLLRFLLQLARASFHNPISQFVYRASRIPVDGLTRLLPAIGRFSIASLVLALTMEWLAIILTLLVVGAGLPGIILPLWWAVLGLAALLVNLYFYGIFAMVVLSWVAPQTHHPAAVLLMQLLEPILGPARRLIPQLGCLDLSPMLVLFALGALRLLLHNLAAGSAMISGLVPGF
ncbi:MAG: YggT family protein [Gammaproteobacteria bacterium]